MGTFFLALIGAAGLAAAAPLVHSDFENGFGSWTLDHSWYENPKGSGLSRIATATGEGRGGSTALKMVGAGNRGIAMRVLLGYPGKYRVSGWIRCENMGKSGAGVLLEWLDRNNTWMSGSTVIRIQGDTPWKHFDTVVDAPPGTRSIHFDLLSFDANRGTVWYDDITLERLKQGLPPPTPPVIRAWTPTGEEGCLAVAWEEKTLAPGCVRLLVYAEPATTDLKNALPRAVLDTGAGQGRIRSLKNGAEYRLAARAVNADGAISALGPAVLATVHDREPPRPGWVMARATDTLGEIRAGWRPHVLDSDLARVHFVVETRGKTRDIRTLEVEPLLAAARPLYATAPFAECTLRLAAADRQTSRVGVWCEDRHGNRSDTAWTAIRPAAASGPAPLDLRLVPPTTQLPHDAPLPPVPADGASDIGVLRLLRGQAKGFQVLLRPQQALHDVHVEFEPLQQRDATGRVVAEIPARWLAAHFVEYVHLPKNSRATPEAELVWPAPADYPDELGDAPALDMAAEKLQPIYLRVGAPRDARPGLYRGSGSILCREGRTAFEFRIRVEPMVLPERPRLKFVYWFSWPDACTPFKVEQFSEDGWRVLARLGDLMRTHHQNVVRVPWSLVHTWQRQDGSLVHDFRDFDRFIRTFQTAGVDAMFCLNHIGGRATSAWECPTMVSHSQRVTLLATGEDRRVDVLDILPDLEAHIRSLGLLDRFAVHVADEPIPKNLPSYRALAAAVQARAPGLRRIDAVHVPDLDGSLEIWVPQLNYFRQWLEQFRAAQKAGHEVWFYVAWVPQGKYPNRMIDSACIKPRILHWMNGIYGTDGYLHWALNDWHISLMSLQSPGDQYICWPSERFIADSSLRYEAEREGLEDCELMFMLEDAWRKNGMSPEQARQKLKRMTEEAVRGFEDYTRDWQTLEQCRGTLLDALEQ